MAHLWCVSKYWEMCNIVHHVVVAKCTSWWGFWMTQGNLLHSILVIDHHLGHGCEKCRLLCIMFLLESALVNGDFVGKNVFFSQTRYPSISFKKRICYKIQPNRWALLLPTTPLLQKTSKASFRALWKREWCTKH